MTHFTHLVLTRYNVRVRAAWSNKSLDPDWLERRYQLFHDYCVPSLCGQTNTNFHWLLFIDPDTPKDYLSQLHDLLQPINYSLHTLETFDTDLWLPIVRRHIKQDSTRVITTRLDNDDSLHEDAIQKIQEHSSTLSNHYLVFDRGLTVHNHLAYESIDTSNAFCSLVEATDSPQTVWNTPHHTIGRLPNCVHVDTEPMWAQIIHESNVSNRVRGKLISDPSTCRNFGWAPNTIRSPNSLELISDRCIGAPFRSARELAIRFAKRFR